MWQEWTATKNLLIRVKYAIPLLTHNAISSQWRTHLISFRCVHLLCCESQGSCQKCLFGIIVISAGPPAESVIATFLQPDLTVINCHVWWHKERVKQWLFFIKEFTKGTDESWYFFPSFGHLFLKINDATEEQCNCKSTRNNGHGQILLHCCWLDKNSESQLETIVRTKI